MTAIGSATPAALGRGLAGLSAFAASCSLDGEIRFDPTERAWGLHLWLEIDKAGVFVPRRSRWCVLLDEAYPYGEIKFYPAAEGGLTATFPHQERNCLGKNNGGRRTGKLCLDSPFAGVRQVTVVRDPIGDSDLRLMWHVERALDWLRAAATGRLQAPGDPFETPWWPMATNKEYRSQRIVHDESAFDLAAWNGRCGQIGQATLGVVPGIDGAMVVGAFARIARS